MVIPTIPIFLDVDMTITNEYQQEPLFRKYSEKLKKYCDEHNVPDFWGLCAKKREEGGQYGVDYLNLMIQEAKKGGCFEGLSNNELFELGKEVIPAKNLTEGMISLKEEFRGKAQIQYYLISVGIKPTIQGFIHSQGLENVITGIAASEFGEHEGIISEPKKIILPFGKNEPIIQFIKGKSELLNTPLYKDEYELDYQNMIILGDGITDSSMMAFAKKKGGSTIVVYTEEDFNGYNKALQIGSMWVDFILPRDYTPNGPTYNNIKKAIETKINRKCLFRPSSLHDLRKGNIQDKTEREFVLKHIYGHPTSNEGCQDCQKYFVQTRVTPQKLIETIKYSYC
jgi:hypothetical protein